jgi:RNA polymerase sigma-70 factor (ECF subfamily)
MPLSTPRRVAARQAKDAALANRVIARPDEAILAAWRRFGPLVRRTLAKMLGPDEEVRDLSQEAFLQLHRCVRALRSPDAIRAFVTGIAVRLALQEIRRRRVRGGQVLVPGQGLVPPASTSADPEAREAMARLMEVVGRLRAADRDLFVLRQIDGLEQSEICAATSMSISTVRRRLRRLERRIGSLVYADPALAYYAERARRRANDATPRPRRRARAAPTSPAPPTGSA